MSVPQDKPTLDRNRTQYSARELADLGSAWQDAGYDAFLAGSPARRRDAIRWYAAYFSRYKRSVCLHAFGPDGCKREHYVALDARLELVK